MFLSIKTTPHAAYMLLAECPAGHFRYNVSLILNVNLIIRETGFSIM